MADSLGNPVDFILTDGAVNDSQSADALLEAKKADFFVADKTYDNNAVLQKIAQMKTIPVIPPKSNRKEQRDFDRHYYKDRNLIERFFCRLKANKFILFTLIFLFILISHYIYLFFLNKFYTKDESIQFTYHKGTSISNKGI